MRKYSILIGLLFFISCGNQQTNNSHFSEEQIALLHLDSTQILKAVTDSVVKIDLHRILEKQIYDFGSLIKEVKLIPLETTDESLVDDIYKILVTDSNIYIHDKFKGGGIIIFDSEGNFIKRMSHGRGPGELVRLYDMDFDKEKNELIAYQHSFFLFFTPSGKFIRQVRLPFGFYNFAVIPDGYVFKTLEQQANEHLMRLDDFRFLVTDKNFKLKFVGLPFSFNLNYDGHHYLYNNNQSISVTQRFIDTIYHYISETNQLKAVSVLDYSKKKLPKQYLQGSTDEFFSVTTENDYSYYLGEYLETEWHNVFFLKNDYIGSKTIIYRDKKSGNLQGGTLGNIDDAEIPPMTRPMATFGNYFIACHFPDENKSLSLISDKENKRKIKDVKEDDNPVLVFFKLKDF